MTLEINQGDTLLYIGYSTTLPVGIRQENQNPGNFQVFQNYPNPVKDYTMVSLFIPERGSVNLMVIDMLGKGVINNSWLLDKGYHSFRFSPGHGNLFFFTARWNGINRSIKILTAEDKYQNAGSLEYIGSDNRELPLKELSIREGIVQESGMLDAPDANDTFTFQFTTNIPCPETPTVTYGGQVYNTIQIFSQCWLKENLNVGIMINGNQDQTDNSIIEKYCYNNEPDSCTKYGGLYQWKEMMQYVTQQGTIGICPQGWHLPTDEEWKVLEGAVDSKFGIGDPEWDVSGDRGVFAGANLKTTSGWVNYGNGSDTFGFSALPGGYRNNSSNFYDVRGSGYWWLSTEHNAGSSLDRILDSFNSTAARSIYGKILGFSVRCIRD
jgi:uncharacterized protein (TIGR02145 family)